MLSELPPEILYLIATYLPTASAVANLAHVCQRLHEIIAVEDWRILRTFVKSRFPNIETPPFWKDAAQALTSRSRALDRHAVVGRFVSVPPDAVKVGPREAIRHDAPTHGYRPAIDSYEVWDGSTWADRKEVLAWGAANELVMRITRCGKNRNERWLVFNDLEHTSSHDDICGTHLLRPDHYVKAPGNEHIIFGRLRGELAHLSIAPDSAAYEYKQRFLTFGSDLERTDLADGPDPILAAHFTNGSIAFYSTTTDDEEVQAFARLQINAENSTRNKYSKFLSPARFAVATGRLEDALAISTISSERLSLDREIGVESLDLDAQVGRAQKPNVTAIAPLNSRPSGGSTGDVFLAAWGDRAVRLHDLRSDKPYEMIYRDTTDQNPVYCVHPFGNDRFVVGAGGDAVVKLFDLRMPKTYSFLDSRASSIFPNKKPQQGTPGAMTNNHINSVNSSVRYPRKDLSIFLSHQPQAVPNTGRTRRQANRSYRGAIYTMSSPSPISTTIYTGIADSVVRLDFASTDDLTGPCQDWYEDLIGLTNPNSHSTASPNRVLELSAYERPNSENTTRTSKLRTQQPFKSIIDEDINAERLTNWDRRWERLEVAGAWRHLGIPVR
ncbi:hypothetical protein FE257_012352 [Aspergillus nanangensis]|uniref:F-box domain-containing protein n=1 Tax=Aspergillus nanangensis TaxID=2582783 RepID=A0AAD4CFX5_ASPNN|nr:hypothetical protein FE257_012352 [Aspergillus nanangensis]